LHHGLPTATTTNKKTICVSKGARGTTKRDTGER
jgi:hypothetical protein